MMLKDVCETKQSLYIVMELCQGGSLMDFIMKVGGGWGAACPSPLSPHWSVPSRKFRR